jgi:hypothetical protein
VEPGFLQRRLDRRSAAVTLLPSSSSFDGDRIAGANLQSPEPPSPPPLLLPRQAEGLVREERA